MKKIISLFQRNYDGNRLVRNEVVPGAEWVLNGEGKATKKYDGTCCMVKDGELYKRYDVKKGRKKPDNFIPAQDPDKTTGHWPGWIKVDKDNPSDKYHLEAFKGNEEDGTYELCGPKVQGNPENLPEHMLVPHGKVELDAPRSYGDFEKFFSELNIEGIVWHHPDGRMVKIKGRDFGIKRQISKN